MKHSTHFRLSDEALALLDGYAQARGLTRTAMLEMMIRLFAPHDAVAGFQQIDLSPRRCTSDTLPDGA
jgi:hypothetical protein